MPRIREFSLESESKAAKKLFILRGLIALCIIISALGVLGYIDWRIVIPLFIPVLYAVASLRTAHRDVGFRREDRLEKMLDVFRQLKGSGFDTACERLEEMGHQTSSSTVRYLDPRTWSNPQRVVTYECWPFSVLLHEKFSKVMRINVSIDEDKEC